MQDMIKGHLAAALKSMVLEIVGILSWSQWAMLIGCVVVGVSLIFKLPDMAFGLLALPFGKSKESKGKLLGVSLLSMAIGFCMAIPLMGDSEPPPPPPPPAPIVKEVVVYKDRIVPILPNLSNFKLPTLADLLGDFRSSRWSSINFTGVDEEEAARLAELERQKGLAKKERERQRKLAIRRRNAEAEAVMGEWMRREFNAAEQEWQVQQQMKAKQIEEMSRPRSQVLPPVSSIRRGR